MFSVCADGSEVWSFDSCNVIVRLCCAHEILEFLHGAPYAVCVELKNLSLCVSFFSCVAVYGCGDVKSWDGCCWWKFV